MDFTEEQYNVLRQLAFEAGISMAEWVRRKVVATAPSAWGLAL